MNSIEIEDIISLSLLSNRAKSEIKLIIKNVPPDASFHIEIINVLGEILIAQESEPSQVIDTSSLPNGIYQLLLFIYNRPVIGRKFTIER